MANPNIASATAVTGQTDVLAVGTTAVAITSNGTASGQVLKVNSLIVSNVGANALVDVQLYRSGVPYRLAKSLNLQQGSVAVVVGRKSPLYLLEGDSLRVVCDSAGNAEAICSYETIG